MSRNLFVSIALALILISSIATSQYMYTKASVIEVKNPNPVDGAQYQPVNSVLSWDFTGSQGSTFTVFLDTSSNPTTPIYQGTRRSCSYSSLQYDAIYYWKVEAVTEWGSRIEGPIWSFITKPNEAPYLPKDPTPLDGSIDQPIDPTLEWTGGDPEDDTITYTVFLDTSSNPTTPIYQGTRRSCYYSSLQYDRTYYWKVTATDGRSQSPGPVWSFSTKAMSKEVIKSDGTEWLYKNKEVIIAIITTIGVIIAAYLNRKRS